ncbi:MAG TPA: thiamine pyrophosphate-dependent enzyme [Candidatus Binatia bacterium]|nr:thiamine pyrophosphate-dependent enzyme [Candidatus Binatia bacterium]
MSALEKVAGKPPLFLSTQHSLCPGCGEPLALRTLLEVIEERALRDRTIMVCGIGCYTAFPGIVDLDVVQALHGRAPSVATGAKRALPDRFVFTLQGDGDMVNEGLQEVIHAAARGEKITAVLLNNGVFGETGGHMTATSVLGQRTKTTMATGRVAEQHGWPIKIADLIAQIDGTAYVARGAMHTPAAIRWTRQCLDEAVAAQLAGRGFSLVEVLTMCPTDWYVEPAGTRAWVEDHFLGPYPLKVLKRP